MNVDRAVNIEDLHRLAKRYLPKLAFDFIEGGVEDESCLDRNLAAFARYRLVPRYLVDISTRDQSTTLFGRTYSSPFGIAPTGFAGLFRRGADLMLAEAAAAANIPYIMSGTSNDSIEAAARVAPSHAWYQLYAARDNKVSEDMIRRARDAGLAALVLTVDVPIGSKRERNIRNGFGRNVKVKWQAALEALTHPAWLITYFRNGMPAFENWSPYAGANANAQSVVDFLETQFPSGTITWRELEQYRKLWPRQLVVKGILHPDDAVRAATLGVDGIIVSNHGGRQLDHAPASLEAFPAIRAAVGDKITLMLDSGVRRGADVLIALCLGAKFVFTGRATLYGAVAGGVPGVRRAIHILRDEIDRQLAQIGCPDIKRIGPDFLMPPGPL